MNIKNLNLFLLGLFWGLVLGGALTRIGSGTLKSPNYLELPITEMHQPLNIQEKPRYKLLGVLPPIVGRGGLKSTFGLTRNKNMKKEK